MSSTTEQQCEEPAQQGCQATEQTRTDDRRGLVHGSIRVARRAAGGLFAQCATSSTLTSPDMGTRLLIVHLRLEQLYKCVVDELRRFGLPQQPKQVPKRADRRSASQTVQQDSKECTTSSTSLGSEKPHAHHRATSVFFPLGANVPRPEEVRALSGAVLAAAMAVLGGPKPLLQAFIRIHLNRSQHMTASATSGTAVDRGQASDFDDSKRSIEGSPNAFARSSAA